jgi:ABC-2 type transport system permease protein
MNLYLQELKSYLKTMLFWILGIVFMVGAGIGKYEAFSSGGDLDIGAILDTLPKAFLAIFGLAGIPIDSFGGFYGMIYAYVTIMGAVFAIMVGSGILAKEERDKTVEFLMVKPISRMKILLVKLLAATTLVLVFVGVTWGTSAAIIITVSPDDPITMELAYMMIAMFFIMMFYLSISFFLAAFLKDAKKSSQMSLTVMLTSYMLGVIMGIIDNTDFLRILVPFQYFRVTELLDLNLNLFYLVFTVVVSLGAIVASAYYYPKRDLMI